MRKQLVMVASVLLVLAVACSGRAESEPGDSGSVGFVNEVAGKYGASTEKPNPYIQYLQQVGAQPSGGGPGGEYLRSVYAPYRRGFELQDTFAETTNAPPGSFIDYLRTQGTDLESIYSRAGVTLSQLFAAGEEGRRAAGQMFGAAGFDQERGVRIPHNDMLGFASLPDQEDLLRLATTPNFGVRGARHFASPGNLARLQNEFDFGRAQGTTSQTSFLDYLRDTFDLLSP